MTSTYVDGTYINGYTLSGAYETITFGPQALIEASVVASPGDAIDNEGRIVVSGTAEVGITLPSGVIDNSGTIVAAGRGSIGVSIAAGTLSNTGIMEGAGYVALALAIGSAVVSNAGTIEQTGGGLSTGVSLSGPGTLTNTGLIEREVIDGTALAMSDGVLVNEGTITAGNYKVPAYGESLNEQAAISAKGTCTIVNDGLISGNGTFSSGVSLASGALMENYGTIDAGFRAYSVELDAGGTLVNDGVISNAGSYGNAIWFSGVASLYNAAPGTIVASGFAGNGVKDFGQYAETISNAGTIEELGSYGNCVQIGSNGTVVNTGLVEVAGYHGYGLGRNYYGEFDVFINSGTILAAAVEAQGIADVSSTAINYDVIEAAGNESAGVFINGSLLTNAAQGTILAEGSNSVPIYFVFGTITNYGEVIASDAGAAAIHEAYGSDPQVITNQSTGVIVSEGSGGIGIISNFTGYLENHGLVEAPAAGVDLRGGGIVNWAGGTIEGSIGIEGYGHVRDAGTIVSTQGTNGFAIRFVVNSAHGVVDYLEVEPGAVFVGKVAGGDGSLIFAGGTGAIAGLGRAGTASGSESFLFSGFDSYVIGKGGDWTIAAGTTIEANEKLIDRGTIVLPDGDPLYIAGHFYAEGTISGTVSVVNANGLLLEGGSDFTGPVTGSDWTMHLGAFKPATISGLGSGTLTGDAAGVFLGVGAYVVNSNARWTLAGDNTFGAGFQLTVTSYGTLWIEGNFVNDGTITDSGNIFAQTALEGTGTIVLPGYENLGVSAAAYGTLDFIGHTSFLTLTDPAAFHMTIEGFKGGDTIELPGLTLSPGDVITYSHGQLMIEDGGIVLADLTISDATAGAIFGLTETDTGITEVVTEYPDLYSPSSHFTMNIPSTMFSAIDAGLQRALHALERLTGEGPPAINIYTQAPLELPGRNPHDPPLFGDANFGNGLPKHPDGTIHLSALSMGIVLAGTTNAEIVGHAANEFAPRELLIGNAGDDTIRGGGGSGSIFSGSGSNEIHTGGGNMLVGSGGTDTIWTGAGYDIVQAYGSATVHAGAGKTVFSDLGTASSHDRVHGGSGRTVMESGLGQDTFIGGSGTSKMIDTGNGHVAFQFNRGAGGNDIVKGFDAAMGDYIRAVPSISFGAKQILGHETVSGGSTFVSLWDGTRIEFVGVTNLTAADFHS